MNAIAFLFLTTYTANVLEQWIQQLGEAAPLRAEQVRDAVAWLIDATVPATLKADFLTALARKGETPEEIGLFARELRARAVLPPLDSDTRQREILDVCGTGGDRLHTFNISTCVALVASAAGVIVAKHGNRAVTSQAGSADVLEALGVRVDLPPAEAARWLKEHRFAFFFAPAYHPAFKEIGPARRLCAERGQRTLFNFLGPLLNPAVPTAQLIGVPRPEWCEPLAQVLQSLGVRRGMVVCGKVGQAHLDEISTMGETVIAEFYQDRGFSVSTLAVEHFPVQPAALGDLTGGDREANARIVQRVVSGQERGPKRDAVLLNSAAALLVAGESRSLTEGWDRAAALIDSGEVARKLKELTQASAPAA